MTRGQINMAAVWVLKSVRKLGDFQYCVLVVCLTDQLINALLDRTAVVKYSFGNQSAISGEGARCLFVCIFFLQVSSIVDAVM